MIEGDREKFETNDRKKVRYVNFLARQKYLRSLSYSVMHLMSLAWLNEPYLFAIHSNWIKCKCEQQ